jgi:hypothetical protein
MSSAIAIPEPRVVRTTIPWEDKPDGVVSLFDMLQFYGDLFTQTLTRILEWEIKCKRIVNNPAMEMNPSIAVEIYAYVGTLIPELLTYGFESASLKAGRIQERLQTARMLVSYGEMVSQLRELRERIEDDFHKVVFVSLNLDESKLYSDPDKGWEDVCRRFSKVRHDIEECSKCFALTRYGAAIFHVLLVAEYGVIQVAELFNVAGDKPGWGALDRLKRIHEKKYADKTPVEQKHAEFLSSLLPLAFAMKDSWRHKISHVDNKLEWMDTDFSPEVAGEIVSATRGFMRRLATDLPK